MEMDVQMMYEGCDHGYVNQISFYVSLCDVDDEKILVEIESMCRDPSFGLATKAKACKGACQEECEDENSHSQVSFHWENWNLSGLPNFQRAITRVKTPHIEECFISLKIY
jgi:hypothetical protein